MKSCIIEYYLNLCIHGNYVTCMHASQLILGSDFTVNKDKHGMQVNAWDDYMKHTLQAHAGSASLR